MPFSLSITPATKPSGTVAAAPDGDLDYTSLVMMACEVLAETDCAFTIGGFGSDDWAVDVAYDLSTLVEQLPDLLDDLRAHRVGEIDLYGQGIERTLYFHPTDGEVRITCTSRTTWAPDPPVESIDREELQAMIARLMSAFSTSLQATGSPLADMAPFPAWR
ncbi:hypothetical protein APR12_004638 [Nocardia amikacinitolerans]|uniref:hypothetical protein n=1 Tax=Nocardia amikacinitolerans TaxID=756689 RepID=UPI00082DAEBC|nr:hypothetical protein [Nocardia amikacinitolerans]MCP2319271.1 hypothetical protein [Nocardia amikacinitolerans]